MDVPNFILSVSELPINMPPKRGHCNDIESSSAAVKRIRIVPDKNQSDETTVMCEVCSQILLSSENHLDEDNTYEEKIIKFQQSFEAVQGLRCRSLVGKYKSQRSKPSLDMWNMKNLNLIEKKKKKRDIGGGLMN